MEPFLKAFVAFSQALSNRSGIFIVIVRRGLPVLVRVDTSVTRLICITDRDIVSEAIEGRASSYGDNGIFICKRFSTTAASDRTFDCKISIIAFASLKIASGVDRNTCSTEHGIFICGTLGEGDLEVDFQ